MSPERQRYDTWIDNQLTAIETQIKHSKEVAEDLMLRLVWYRELKAELLKRGNAHVLG